MAERREITAFVENGNIESFEKFFRFYYARLKKYAFHFLQNEEDANDLVQDVFIQIWTQRESIDIEKNTEAFLFTLVKNKCLNSLKKAIIEEKFIKQQTYLESEKLYHISFTKQKDFKNMEEQMQEELAKAMDLMPERCRTAFHLRWIEGRKQKEIADIMNISMTMVNKHLSKGMEIVRKHIKPDLFLLLFLFN